MANAEPRNKTTCFTLSETEKLNLDKLCLTMNTTRSSLLSHLVVEFVNAAQSDGSLVNISSLLEKAVNDHQTHGQEIENITNQRK